jgi:2-polyprenyl-6-methoxyphenol hydroxylase-like FAD-dependent oxidoreductase
MGALKRRSLILVLPHRLEELLELALRDRGVRIRWGHRLDDLRQDGNAVTSSVEKLALTSVGYPYARSEEMVQSEVEVRARFVVGADGAASHVAGFWESKLTSSGRLTTKSFEFEAEAEATRRSGHPRD